MATLEETLTRDAMSHVSNSKNTVPDRKPSRQRMLHLEFGKPDHLCVLCGGRLPAAILNSDQPINVFGPVYVIPKTRFLYRFCVVQ